MEILAYIVPIIITYIIVKHFWISTLTLKSQYKFYALRDKLRMSAISGDVNSKDRIFDYLDYSLSKTITELPKLNAWVYLYYYLLHRKDIDFNSFQKVIDMELAKNKKYKEVYDSYRELTGNFILKKSIISLVCMSPIMFFIVKAMKNKEAVNTNTNLSESQTEEVISNQNQHIKALKRLTDYTTLLPETSVAPQYYSAFATA